MSINYSEYRKDKTPKINFSFAPKGKLPKEIANLAQFTDAADRRYFTYRNYDGVVQSYVIRKEAHETKNGSKLFIPYSFDEDKQDWIKKAWDKDRCLFDEHKLKEQLELPVLISEGEKAAVYGKNNLKSYVHVTWQGGSNAVHKTNFKYLKDREVILFPDNDEEGIKAMVHVAKILIEGAITTNIK